MPLDEELGTTVSPTETADLFDVVVVVDVGGRFGEVGVVRDAVRCKL